MLVTAAPLEVWIRFIFEPAVDAFLDLFFKVNDLIFRYQLLWPLLILIVLALGPNDL